MEKKNTNDILVPLMVVMALMFFWNMSRNINDILIPHLKRACQLNDFESSLVQSAFFGAYFMLALPAGWYIHKKGYKNGIVLGLVLACIGAFCFFPAAQTRIFPLFLMALFIMAAGFTFLEVSATPYVSKLGDEKSASSRLSLSAAVGSVGATIAPYIGAKLLLHKEDIPQSAIDAYNPIEKAAFLASEANLVKLPYMTLGLLFVLMAFIVYRLKLPVIQEEDNQQYSFKKIFQYRHTCMGVLSVFAYVGAEVGIVSFLIRYSKSLHLSGLTEQKSADFITLFMGLVLFGRLTGAWFLKLFKNSGDTLCLSAGGAFVMVLLSVISTGYPSIWALSLVGLFTSIMYPVIFTLSIKNLGSYTKTASSLLIMGVVGGAVVPPIMGYVSDKVDIKWAFVAPLICYLYVLLFGVLNRNESFSKN